jgi:predicted  nucleic acid-binding Zn-ribbon protein
MRTYDEVAAELGRALTREVDALKERNDLKTQLADVDATVATASEERQKLQDELRSIIERSASGE